MKDVLLVSLATLFSMSAHASTDFSQRCVSADGVISLEVTMGYNRNGSFTGSAQYEDIELSAAQSTVFRNLEGWTGDHDNNRSVQLTFLDAQTKGSTALLIVQTKVDRGDTTNEVTNLNCEAME